MAAGPVSASVLTRRRMWVLLGTVGSLLVVALVVLLIVWRGGAGTPGAATAGRPQPSSSPAPQAITPEPAATSAPGVPRPTQCEQLYSPAMVAAFDDLVLNPAWVTEENSGVTRGSDDAELVTLIDAAGEHLTCVWANENGGSGLGLTTELVWVTPEQQSQVQSRLTAAGMNCYEELDGMRCLLEATENGELAGESHFLRDGIWLATRYFNAGPDGYTHDIIANVWRDA
ncbi:hypothetical protein E3T23_04635 [Cryobacterium cheniae]|uniref:DUF3558 domain-containing protein n=1 Tax=Cryobacterium cheniae TaxID=1259262 RepID=A0A4R8XXD8_9MICO|nr:hypothetical protein [Cryobacterium cheniae]TFC82230.1 hypothetical protein E3T23_04635 [Cryobacterium cheniae]